MTHTLSFAQVYKSITNLPSIDLPTFVVLTGRNGSGKTHLLEALQQGRVSSSIVKNHNTDVLLYNWNTIIPKDTGVFHVHQHLTQRSNWFNQIRTQQDKFLPSIQQEMMNLGIPREYCSTLRKIKNLSKPKIMEFAAPAEVDDIFNKVDALSKKHGQKIYNQTQRHIGDENWKKIVPQVANEKPELFLETSESKFFGDKRLLWGEIDPFQHAFGQLFATYRDLIHQNDRLEKYPPQDVDLAYLDEEKFLSEFGEPPWDFVNRILEVCKLDFRVNSPPLHETSSFEPKLYKLSSDVEMKFADLSSGEKVLMSFALCLYNAKDTRQKKLFPKLLLLDEVDAPLHPSMVKSLLNTIQTVLVGEHGISVILTTHSPSTVALAPEESLYEMNPTGPNVEKINKSSAVSLLTTGVPTLSISYEGRRQVFVESNYDAKIYESLYQILKSHLDSERSLSFIEVGHKTQAGQESNAGCDQVKRIVKALSDSGNQSVFGLIDWDGSATESERIKVLSPDIRNGLESAIFDPVLLIASCIRENINYSRHNQLISSDETYVSLSTWSQDKWQFAVDKIQEIILGPNSDNETVTISYLNGMQILVRKDFLHTDDHKIENIITQKIEFFKPKNKVHRTLAGNAAFILRKK